MFPMAYPGHLLTLHKTPTVRLHKHESFFLHLGMMNIDHHNIFLNI